MLVGTVLGMRHCTPEKLPELLAVTGQVRLMVVLPFTNLTSTVELALYPVPETATC